MNFSSPAAPRANSHLVPGGEAGAAAAADVGGLDRLEQRLGRDSVARGAARTSRRARSAPARRAGSPGAARRPRRVAPASRRSTTPGPASIDVAVAHRRARRGRSRGRRSRRGRPRRRRRARRARGRARLELVDVARRRSRRSTPCRCRRARAARPRGAQQVVVERRDAVDRRLGQAGALGRDPAVVVGDLAASIHRLFEHFERGGRSLLVVAPDQFHQISRHVARSSLVSRHLSKCSDDRLIDGGLSIDPCSSASSSTWPRSTASATSAAPRPPATSSQPTLSAGDPQPGARARRAARAPRARVRGLTPEGELILGWAQRALADLESLAAGGLAAARRPRGHAADRRDPDLAAASRRRSPRASASATRACACG